MEGRTNKQVFLKGDRAVTLQELMQIVDRLKSAGVTDIGFVSTTADQ
jgi:biopolymer transport protein ExbD